jgi:predicted CxxxxCH...CXXCH cytochrome family protein
MTVPIHSFRDYRRSLLSLILLVAFAGIAGCTNDKSSGGVSSPADWVVVPSGGRHAKSATLTYIANGGSSSCIECHGADLSGGSSKVSCFGNPSGCHHGPAADWVVSPPAAQNHGVAAKKAPGNSGFASCQICHGRYFSGGGSQVSCFSCHGANAPHPPRPWLDPAYTHISTNTENAPVCAQCHFPGSPNNPANHPATPAAAGTPPGCFNSTLCHGATAAPHALGTAWRDPNPQFHGLSAKQDLSYCQGCHGTPGTTLFNGGIAPTSCQTSTCHTRARAHSMPWYQAPQPFPTYTASHRDSGNRSVACAICHKVDGLGTGPDSNAPSCFSVSSGGITCHSGGPGGVIHSVPFPGATHTSADQTSFNADCSVCHAITGVSPNSVAPLCTVCHRSTTALPFTNCTSCHARPPSGTEYPNVAGSHARHEALANVTGVCASCHNGLGSGTAGHYDRANARPGKDALRVPPGDAAFLAVYNAKAGPAAFDNAALTCANVSCHGGVTAPNWRTGTIAENSDAGCRLCHKIGTAAGNPENNSPFSGLHAAHLSTTVGGAILCTDCHNMANGTVGALNHYKFLDTSQMEGPAGDTVAPNGSAANYVAANQTCGTFTCHTIVHVNFSWNGGVSHPVPFTGGNHTSVTSSNFATNCGSCHFETGSATKLGPTCTVCHQSGSPLTSLNCTSCHGDPPSGATYPNVAGKHAVHGALPGVGVCNPCHNGLDAGTLEHYNRANARPGKNALRVPPGDIAFLPAYNAESGTAAFNPTSRTCSNVICHGGQATPDWQTATANAIDVPNACLSCHVSGTPQYNSYFSGDHARHISAFGLSATTCKRCHDVAKVNVSGHFQNLATPAFEQPPPETILPAVRYNGNTCNPQAGGLTGCHGSKKW